MSQFDEARRRIEKRQQRRNVFYVWLSILAIVICLDLDSGTTLGACLIPVTMLVALVAAAQGLRLCHDIIHRALGDASIHSELEWLYGDVGAANARGEEYFFAENRILQRQRAKWSFAVHFTLFLLINGFVLLTDTAFSAGSNTVKTWLYAVTVIWLGLLIRQAWLAFPPRTQSRRSN
jgi:hypothetical protein